VLPTSDVFWVKNWLPDPVSPRDAAVEHVDRACVLDATDVRRQHADGQVGEAIVI
jgi:hypothetical protein